MSNGIKIALTLTVIAVLTFGGYQAKHKIGCNNLQEDLVNSMRSQKNAIQLRSLGRDNADLVKTAEFIELQERQATERLITRLVKECGSRDAQTAITMAGQALGL